MISPHKKWLRPLLAGLFCFSPFIARADITQAVATFGDLKRWSAFSLGGGVTGTDTVDEFTGTTDIYGDVGVYGDGNITLTGSATIHGSLYQKTGGVLTTNGNSRITGNRYQNAATDGILLNSFNEANNASAQAGAYASSTFYAGVTSITSSMTIYAQHDRPGNSTVLNLNTINLNNHYTLTLSGTAADVFIFNVSGQFSLTSQSKIVLSGGVTWDDVLFNIKGSGTPVTLDGQSSVDGIIMANQRSTVLTGGSTVRGEVISNKIKLSGSSRIAPPSITSL